MSFPTAAAASVSLSFSPSESRSSSLWHFWKAPFPFLSVSNVLCMYRVQKRTPQKERDRLLWFFCTRLQFKRNQSSEYNCARYLYFETLFLAMRIDFRNMPIRLGIYPTFKIQSKVSFFVPFFRETSACERKDFLLGLDPPSSLPPILKWRKIENASFLFFPLQTRFVSLLIFLLLFKEGN